MAFNLELAGLSPRDIVTDRHPYLHLAALPALMRRARSARFTPGGMDQPPEVAGVDADARVPNRQQPMSGEFEDGYEVAGGRPTFFGALMPPPTGVANGVGVGAVLPPSQPAFGAPTGMPAVGADRLSALQLVDCPCGI